MPKPSPSKNPFAKQMTPLERLRYQHKILQRAQTGAAQNSLLLDLPPELRNRVYEHVLVSNDSIEVDPNYGYYGIEDDLEDDLEEDRSTIKEPPLLQTCQMIRNEATQLYYSSNRFSCRTKYKLFRWIQGFGTSKRAMLKDVRASDSCDPAIRDQMDLVYLLADVDSMEGALQRSDCPVGKGVLRVYNSCWDGVENPLTGPKIRSMMNEVQWELYVEYQKIMERMDALLVGR